MSNTTSGAQGAVTLAPELIDRILDFLHSSVASLTTSSLVCRNWLPTTRHHLFSTPVLYQISFNDIHPKDNTGSFIELLGSPQCTFRHMIQGCVLNIENVRVLRKCVDALAAADINITGRLLIAQYIGYISFMNDLKIHTRFPYTRNFVYVNHDIWAADLIQLVTSLKHLESLSVLAIPPLYDEDEMPDFPVLSGEHVFPRLRTLRLRMFNPSRWLTWMLSLPGYTPQIHTLDIMVYSGQYNGWGYLGGLEPFLAANRYTLKDLTINVEQEPNLKYLSDEPVTSQLDLRILPNLRSLTLRTRDIDSLFITLTTFLESISVPLEILTLEVSDQHCRAKLQEIFEGRFYNKINLLCIVFSYPLHGDTLTDNANSARAKDRSKNILPSWEGRGALKVMIAGGPLLQPDSLEKINSTIWGSRAIPFAEKLTRLGTL